MQKKMTLETISFKQRRAKIDNAWYSLSPFINMDALKFNQSYEVIFEMDKSSGTWFVSEMK